MRQLLLACAAVASLACASTDSSLRNATRKVDDGGFGAGGIGSGGRGTGGARTGGAGSGGSQGNGCGSDLDCKGSRICENGRCVDPPGAGGQGAGGLGAGGIGFVPDASAGAQPGAGGGQCAAVKQAAENIVVYREASVTDTIVTTKPVALFFMIDRSTSMVSPSSKNWDDMTAAVTAFVNDPRTAGIDIGLGTFPSGSSNTADCAGGSDCGSPVVAIASLPANANAMVQAMQTQKPGTGSGVGTPTECGLRGTINQCLSFMAQSPVGEQCVAVLITDGAPTACDLDQTNLAAIVADGRSKGVTTFTLGLSGADFGFLDALAAAGGTSKAIDVSSGAPAFIQALDDIRKTVVVTTTTVVSTPVVVSSPLPCEWMIPPPPQGQIFQSAKVNIEIASAVGGTQIVPWVPSAAACSRVAGDAWFYDDIPNPTRAILCPDTCARVKSMEGVSVNVLLGCDTQTATPM